MSSFSTEVLKDRNVLKVFLGQLTSQISDKIVAIGLIWVIVENYGQEVVPWYIAMTGIPHLLFISLVPKVLSRVGVMKTIIWSDFLRGIVFILLGAAFYVADQSWQIYLIFILAFISQAGAAFFNPAIYSLPMQIVQEKHISRVSSLLFGCTYLSNLIGPLIAIALFKFLGLPILLLVNGVTYLLSALVETTVKTTSSDVTSEVEEDKLPSVIEVMKKYKMIAYLLTIFVVMNFLIVPIFSFLPLYVKYVYHGTIDSLLVLESALGAGGVLSFALLALYSPKGKVWKRIFYSYLVTSVMYLLFCSSTTLLIGAIALFIYGATMELGNIMIMSFFQLFPKPKDVPTVMTVLNISGMVSYPLSLIALGFILDSYQINQIGITLALINLVVVCMLPFIPGFRKRV